MLIVISDGGDNASTHSLVDVLKSVEQSGALAYAIGIFDEDDPDENPAVLRRLAHVTGGEAFFPRQLNEVVAICEHNARDGRKRKLNVRTRAGYIAAVKSPSAKSEDTR